MPLATVERSDTSRPKKNTRNRGGTFGTVLKDLELAESTPRRWQTEAKIPRDTFEEHIRSMTEAFTLDEISRRVRA